jgi:hydrocephalus-inducing protein
MTSLAFGQMRVGQSKPLPLTFRNRSKYPAHFELDKHGKQAAQLLKIEPSEGTIPGGDKTTVVSVVFNGLKLIRLDSNKILTLRVTDSMTSTVTNTLSIPLSAETVYSTYTITPSLSVDFAIVPVLTPVSRSFTIQNTGTFPFDFEITPPPEPVEPVRGRGRRAPARPPPARNKKGKAPTTMIGPFTVTNSMGTILPRQSAVVSIDFQSPAPSHIETHAMLKITDLPPCDPDLDLTLIATAISPGLANSDYEQIFQGRPLCLRSDVV